MGKSLYTTAEAAAELGVTAGRVRQMIVDKELRAEKLGRDLFIRAVDVAEAKKRKTTPGPAVNQTKPRKRSKRTKKKGNTQPCEQNKSGS